MELVILLWSYAVAVRELRCGDVRSEAESCLRVTVLSKSLVRSSRCRCFSWCLVLSLKPRGVWVTVMLAESLIAVDVRSSRDAMSPEM